MTEHEQFQAVYNGIAAIMTEIVHIIERLDRADARLDRSIEIRRQQYREIIAEVNARATGVHTDLERVYRRIEALERDIHTHHDPSDRP